MAELDLTYPAILQSFGKHLVKGRTESRAFLGWFLENYFRLEQSRVEDSICDGPDDKGIDGVYVDSTLETIYVFQTKLVKNAGRTLGDTQLKEFAGSVDQLSTRQKVEALEASTGNIELRGLIKETDLGKLVEDGYELRGVFITNVKLDSNGTSYLSWRTDLSVFDEERLIADWLPLGDTEPIEKKISFSLDGLGHIEYTTGEAKVYVVSLLASELVTLAGIENQGLFAWNVRQSLGRTKVNRAIAESVREIDEHKNFMLYHNGLTILAADVEFDKDTDRLAIDRYNVVNGCQSLSTLYENRSNISDELRILARVIRLSPSSDLAASITRHSNNQNAIGARDLQSNSGIQKRLKEDFKRFSTEFGYEVKRGERVSARRVITNEEAARILLAFDLEQPWSCHQSYRYFDDLHSEIFGRPVVTASRIVGLLAVRDAVFASLEGLENRLAANYSVTPFFVMYLVRAALEADEIGKAFCQDPGQFVTEKGYDSVVQAIRAVVDDLIVDLNAELEERAERDEPFDHKRELKSPNAVRALKAAILPSYEKAIKRGRAAAFGEEWSTITSS